MTSKTKTRFQWLDMCKGLGIILVVASHALAPGRYYFHIFQVAMFMLLSGFVYNDRDSFWIFLKKKFQTIYLPFVGWNLVVIFLREGALALRLHETDRAYPLARLGRLVGLQLLTFYKDGRYLGATWFLGSLFLIAVVYKLVDLIIPRGKYRQIGILLIFAGIACVGLNVILPYLQSRTLVLSFFYALGRVLRLHWKKLERLARFGMGVLFAVMFWILSHFTAPGLQKNDYKNPYIFMVCAFCAIAACICFMVYLTRSRILLWKPICAGLSYLGKASLDIMIWHILAFKAVMLLQLFREGAPFLPTLAEKIVYKSAGTMWCYCYIVVGIVLSILWSKVLRLGPWGWFLKKIHFVN